MKRSLSSSPTGLAVSLRICSSCSVMLWVELFSHWSTISSFTSSTHCTPCQKHHTHLQWNVKQTSITWVNSRIIRATCWRSVCEMLPFSLWGWALWWSQTLRRGHHHHCLPAPRLAGKQSEGTGEYMRRVETAVKSETRLNSWVTHLDDTSYVILLNDEVCHLWCIYMSLQKHLLSKHDRDDTSEPNTLHMNTIIWIQNINIVPNLL